MTALDLKIIERKMDFMRQALLEIEKLRKMKKKDYLGDMRSQIIMERLIERLVEAGVDASAHILKVQFKVAPATYRETYLELGKRGIISSDLASNLARSAGLRNIIAHQYDEIDHDQVFEATKDALRDYPAFLRILQDLTK